MKTKSKNSILNLLLDLRRYLIKGHLGPKRQVCYVEYFEGLGFRKFGTKMVPHSHLDMLWS
jgi:hypothetical protein